MKYLRDINVSGKRVLVRVDFNVSLDENGGICDDFKIRAALPTINYLVGKGAKTILISHLKDPQKGERFSLRPAAERLAELAGRKVEFTDDCVGGEAERAVDNLESGDILLLENLRFYQEEKQNDAAFAQKLAGLAEIYVNDAFAESHRDFCSSTIAITRFLPSFAGLLMESEIKNLTRARDHFESPLCVVIGGAKVSTKIKFIRSYLNKADDIILGGALANTVLRAKGVAIGRSITEETMALEIKDLEITSAKIHLPIDALICADKDDFKTCHPGPVGLMQDNEAIYDIGFDTEKLFAEILNAAKTIVWNGPMGLFEKDYFARGTRAVAQAVARSGAFSVVGGGETITFLEKAGLVDKISFLSTGGGAMLAFLSGEKMPGIEALG